MTKKVARLQIAIVVFSAIAVFWGSLHGGLLTWDDRQILIDDPSLRDLSFDSFVALWTRVHNMLYIPAVQSAWFLNGLAFGQWDPVALHAMNLVFHALNCGLVLLILRRLIPREFDHEGRIALVATLLFALHPTRIEAVTWIAGFKEVLAASAGLSALLMYLLSRDEGTRWKWWRATSVVLFAFSLVAKPAFVVLPVCLLVLEWPRRNEWRQTLARLSPYLALSFVVSLATLGSQEPHLLLYVPPLWARFGVAADAIGFYLLKIVWPLHVAPDYGRMPGLIMQEPANLLAWTLTAFAFVLVGLAIAKRRDLWKAFALFVISLVPLLGLVPFYFQQISTVADRYLYFPSLWVSLLVGLAISRLKPALQKIAVVFVLVFVVACGVKTLETIPKWHDDQTFFNWMLEENPRSFNAANRLGDLDRDAGNYERALQWYEASRAVAPWQPYPWLNSAFVKFKLGRKQESIDTLKALLATYPGYEPAEANLKRLLEEK